MLGVRESVGGANGVECELEARLWEESESPIDGTIMEHRRQMLQEILKRQRKEQSQQQRIEVVLGPLKVKTIDTPDDEEEDDEEEEEEEEEDTVTSSNGTNNDAAKKAQQYHEKYLTSQCERISKYKFSPQTFYLGSNTSEPLPHKYKFKVYAPVVFQRIRTLFGVEKQTFLHSICGKFNLYEFASNAKSGQVSFIVCCDFVVIGVVLTFSLKFHSFNHSLLHLQYFAQSHPTHTTPKVLLLLPRRTLHDQNPHLLGTKIPPPNPPRLLPPPNSSPLHIPHPLLRAVSSLYAQCG